MRVRKTVWIFSVAILLAALLLIINSRINLRSEIILGGAENGFISTDNLKKPLDDYGSNGNPADSYEYPDVKITDWQYVLINGENPSQSFVPQYKEVRNTGAYFSSSALSSLNSLIDAATEAGFTPYIDCGYRSYSAQQYTFTAKANQLSADGTYSFEEAVEIARSIVAYPGTSDHQTGLGVDILDKKSADMDYSKMDKEFYAWRDEHCAEFGFIKRYPSDRKDDTGWDEPWHYRYVGVEAAQFITEHGLILEEFVAHYR